MIYKIAKCPVNMSNIGASYSSDGIVRIASGKKHLIEPKSEKSKVIEAAIKKHPTALFFRGKAIVADEPNSNGDCFPEEELVKAYKSFFNVPFFTNHDNQNVENARGKVIFAEWIPEEKAIYTVSFVDREAYPHICRSIEESYISGVSMGALNGDALIVMADLTEKRISEINAGEEILSAYGNRRRVKMVHNEYLGKPMYSFDLSTYHKTPKFTDDHPVFMIEKSLIESCKKEAICIKNNSAYEKRMGRIEESIGQDTWRNKDYSPDAKFVEANKIQKDDFVLVPSKFKTEDGESLNSDFYYVVGAYLGDGYLKKDRKGEHEGVSFCLGLNEIELAEKITTILKKYSKAEPCNLVCEDRNGLYITLYDRKLAKWLEENVGTGSKTKRLKFNLKFKEDALNLLAGYLDTDGCIAKKRNPNHTSAYQISSANLGLLEDIQSLLISLDSISRISSFNRVPSENSIVRVNTIEHTLSVGSNSSSLFKHSIKFKINSCDGAKIKCGKTFIVKVNGNNFMACPVKEVYVEDFNEPVYDLTVEEDECYIADGVGVHNCSVEYSICNICGNRAEQTEDYCSHIRERKGRSFSGTSKNVITGEVKQFKNEPVFEYNYGIKFIELSAVVDPACPTCRIEELINNDDILKKVANLQNAIYMYRTSSINKEAGQPEIEQLNQVLQTLETISVSLIQNRQQIEVDFASDLVGILSELQKFVDELVGAGYGSVQSQQIPGLAPQQQPMPGAVPMGAGSEEPMPLAQEQPIGDEQVGDISGSPTQPLVATPSLPITAPAKPLAFDSRKIQKIAGILNIFTEQLKKEGDKDMAGRRTIDAKNKQKESAAKILSNSWKEKVNFFEYINKVPSLQDNEHKLSVKKRDDSFVIVAETKDAPSQEMVWTYETLTDDEKNLVQRSPKEASSYFLNRFAGSLKINKKQGENNMSITNREAGASSVNKDAEVVTEKQLETSDLYHKRQNEEKHVVTQKQLEALRSGEQDVLTEAQLAAKNINLNPRKDESKDVITEEQLNETQNASPRQKEEKHSVTQKQLDPNRTDADPQVITERQLDATDAPWSRAASRNSSMFKSAGDHMTAVVDAMADTVISTGCTPDEAIRVASSLVASTKDRYELCNAMLDEGSEEEVDYSKRLAYWSKKNIRVAGVGTREIAQSVVSGLRKFAADETINPDTIIDAIDVITEDKIGEESISSKVEQKLEAATKETVKVSKKEQLRQALQSSTSTKESREKERQEILASIKKRPNVKKASNLVPDTMIETDFDELGCTKNDPQLKSTIKSFAKGALASRNVRLAAITNVTISGDTISIAVQTDTGEQSVEIPIGEEIAPSPEEIVPEGDLAGEGMAGELGASPLDTGLPTQMASSKKQKRTAQVPSGAGIPGTPGGVSAPGAPDSMPGIGSPADMPVESLMTDAPSETALEDEIPTAGEQQPPWAICPECGSSDVDVSNEEGDTKGTCNNCGAEYEAWVKKQIEFKILKPTKSVGEDAATGAPEIPEVPALPVAAQTKLNKAVMKRIASNKEKYGHVCPACGMTNLKSQASSDGHFEYACPACGTDVEKDILVDVNDPNNNALRVKWDLIPNIEKCTGCEDDVKKFASLVRVQKIMKTASENKDSFPMANCVERMARKYGGNTVSTFGPCKGKVLADCVCNQLQKLGMTKVRHMDRLASVYTMQDPMDECVEDQMKKEYSRKEAETICNCLKKKVASKNDDNAFMMAFAQDISEGREDLFMEEDLDTVNDLMLEDEVGEAVDDVVEEDIDIGAPLEELDEIEVDIDDTVTLEVSKETAQELSDAVQVAVPEEVEIEVELEEVPEETMEVAEDVPAEEVVEDVVEDVVEAPVEVLAETEVSKKLTSEEEKEMAMAMKVHKILRVGEEVIKLAATPKVVKDIEGNVEAGVPRAKATIRNESPENIDKPMAKPNVPRKESYMGKEKEADSLINKPLVLPDVAVDSAYMGVNEKSNQANMPPINNELKGTVIAKEEGKVVEAKKMKEVDSVEDDVEAGVPRAKATMGNEGKDNIDVDVAKPDVPRAKATMGNEGPDNIDVKADSPDVPIDNAYMGEEKDVQKDMPDINDKYLKNVQQNKEIQLERIATARRMKAVETSARLLATNRISEEAYNHVVEALSKFKIDEITNVAETMYPKLKKQASTSHAQESYSGPAIVMESKETTPSSAQDTLIQRLSSNFTIGNRSFDENLTRFGSK